MKIFPYSRQNRSWSLPSKWSFWAAVVGIPITAGSIIISVFPLFGPDESRLERNRLKFRVSQELDYNFYWLRDVAEARANGRRIPVGTMKTAALLELVDTEYLNIIEHAYGEERYIYQLALTLNDLAVEINKDTSNSGFRNLETRSRYNLHDVLFLNGFLDWYLKALFDENRCSDLKNLFKWLACAKIGDTFSISEYVEPKLRYFVYDNNPITSYSDYLGLID